MEERFVGSQEDCPQMIQQPRRRLARLSTVLAVAVLALLPAAAPAVAADPVVLRVGTTQPIETTNPWNTVSRRPSTTPCSSPTTSSPGSARTPSPAPGFADTWERGRRPGDLPHPRRDEVLGRDAGDGAGRVLQLGPRARRDQGQEVDRLRLPRTRASRTRASRRSSARTTARSSPTRRTSRTASSRSTSRSCPSTSGASSTTRTSTRRSSTPPLVGSGPYTLAECEDRTSSRGSSATPTTGATRASPTRWSCSSTRTPTRWCRR